MDDVPVVNANPVNIIIKKPEPPKKKSRSDLMMDSIKNFFMILPMALIVVLQFYWLGQSFGSFSTFPLTSEITYILIVFLGMILLFTQLLMRSIIYSTVTGVFLIFGILTAWFGNFFQPLIENFHDVALIIESAWSSRDIPYNLLVTGLILILITGIAFVQFLASLIVKSFFELFFGKEWGDGRGIAYLATMALLLGIQLGFSSYASISGANNEQQVWEKNSYYEPPEKILTRTAGSFQLNKEYLYIEKQGEISAIEMATGKVINKNKFSPAIVHSGFEETEYPVFADEKSFYGYNFSASRATWKTDYPASFTTEKIPQNTPLTTMFIDSGKKFLAMYDQGFFGSYDSKNGKQLWLAQHDMAIKTNRTFPDKFLKKGFIVEMSNKLIISCHNAIIKCLDRDTGELIWKYEHRTPKINGKSHRGYLTPNGNRIVIAYKSGECITLSIDDGRLIYRAINSEYVPISPVITKNLNVFLLTPDGIFYRFEQDGGKRLLKINTLPKKSELVPIIQNLEYGIVAHKDQIVKIDTDSGKTEIILTSPRRIFVTEPVFMGKIMFIGTEDGWIHCIHYGSKHEKWRVHVNGELQSDSLYLSDDGLLVKTKSGSIYKFKTTFI